MFQQLLRCCLAVSLVLIGGVAFAQGAPRRVALADGVELVLPAVLQEALAPSAAGLPGRVEHFFSDGAAQPLLFWVQSGPAELAALPAPGDAAEGQLAGGMLAGLAGMEDAQIGPYDPARGALGVQFEKRATLGTPAYLSGVAFFLRDHTVLALFAAPLARASDVRTAAALLWEQSRVPLAALPPRSQAAAFNVGRQIGVVLGSLIGGACLLLGSSWLLRKLGLSRRGAVGGAGLALVCSAALFVVLCGSLDLMIQLACYVLVAALGYAWVLPRLEAKPRKRLLTDERGLSTVEYVVLLVLVGAMAIGAWQAFGSNVRSKLAGTSDHIFDTLDKAEEQAANDPSAGVAMLSPAQSGTSGSNTAGPGSSAAAASAPAGARSSASPAPSGAALTGARSGSAPGASASSSSGSVPAANHPGSAPGGSASSRSSSTVALTAARAGSAPGGTPASAAKGASVPATPAPVAAAPVASAPVAGAPVAPPASAPRSASSGGATTVAPASVPPPSSPPSAWQRAKDYVEQSAPIQTAMGVGFGTLQTIAPGGFLVPSPGPKSKAFEVGRGIGQMATGITQVITGVGMMGGGGTVAAGGGLAAVPSAGTSLVVSGAGLAVATEGAVVAGVGATNAAAGLHTLTQAMSMSSSSGSSGSAPSSTPAPAAGETPATPPAPKAPTESAAARAARMDELAKDPAHAGQISVKTRAEAEVGMGLEDSGHVQGLRRDPTGAGEFIDAKGTTWDVKGFNSKFPPKKGGFEVGKAMDTIHNEVNLGESVMVDTRNMSAAHTAELKEAVAKSSVHDKVLFWP